MLKLCQAMTPTYQLWVPLASLSLKDNPTFSVNTSDCLASSNCIALRPTQQPSSQESAVLHETGDKTISGRTEKSAVLD